MELQRPEPDDGPQLFQRPHHAGIGLGVRVRIGIDLDNTIVGYDHVFAAQVVAMGFLKSASGLTKKQIRDEIRATPHGDEKWQKVQAVVYGPRMEEAVIFPGVGDFLVRCRETGTEVFVVSHKTRFAGADKDGTDLRAAARRWLAGQKFHDPDGFAIREENIFFESTRLEKIRRIGDLACTHFIDDLEEVFRHPEFPGRTERILFASGATELPTGPFHAAPSWDEISDAIFATVS